MRLLPSLTPPSGDLADLVVGIVNQANRYTLGTWLPTVYPAGVGPIVANTETAIRHPSAAALGLAAALACGVHDETVTGVSAQDATTAVVDVVAAVSAAHGTVWGGTWQSALWATLAGSAGWLVWDALSDQVRADVLDMVAAEADLIDGEPPYWCTANGTVVTPGDSKAEENAWNAGVVALAVAMLPEDPRHGAWTQALCRWGLSAYATRGDLSAGTVRNGIATSSLGGYNAYDDGTVVNHSIVHPDYMAAGVASLWSLSALFGAAGVVWPSAAWHGAERTYGALHLAQFTAPPFDAPGGTIYVPESPDVYYPQGNDWGTARIMDKACADVVAHARGWGGTNAHAMALRHLNTQAALQARSSTGQTYIDLAEDAYPGREQWVAHHAAWALLALATDVTESNAPAADLAALNSTRGTVEATPMITVPMDAGWEPNVVALSATESPGWVDVNPGRVQRKSSSSAVSVPANTPVRFATLPAALAPAATQVQLGSVHMGGFPVHAEIRVDTTGAMSLVSSEAGTIQPGGGSSYIVVGPMRWAT